MQGDHPEAEIQPNIGGKQFSVYFGELHGHTRFSPDAIFFIRDVDPEEYYRYARDIAGLDFAAMTDHDAPYGLRVNVRDWEAILDLNKKFHAPGRFVTFNAYEWTSGDGVRTLSEYIAGRKWSNYEKDKADNTLFGHRNVFFPADEVPGRVFSMDSPESDTPQKLWDLLRPYGAISIPHHPLGGPVPPFKWNFYDPEVEPLVEIYSYHGNSESDDAPLLIYNPYGNGLHNVRFALNSGHKFGIISSSDHHMGRGGYLGNDLAIDWMREQIGGTPARGGGLACIYSEGLTREKLWDSFLKRRTYGTTGEKIILDFSLGHAFMGEDIVAGKPQVIKVKAIGTGAIRRIEIIRNGSALYSMEHPDREASLDYMDEDIQPGRFYYYIRLTQEDGEMAWSSPIWITYQI